MIFRKCIIFFLSAVIISSGCARLDNLDSDDFNLFKNKLDGSSELRRYAEVQDSDQPLVEYLADLEYKPSVEYKQHFRKMCDYTKIPFRSHNIKTWGKNPEIATSTRVLCVLDTKMLPQAAFNKIFEFVASGGTLFIPFASEDRRLGFLLGFKPEAEFTTDSKSAGYYFTSPVIPGMQDVPYNDPITHFGYETKNFSTGIKVLATATNNKNYYLMTENAIGKGKVVFYNTSVIFEKIERGLLFSGMVKGLEGIPYPVVNVATMFLDDFPSPLYNIKLEPIKSEMDLTVTDFVKDVWWPDMIALAKKYDMKYAAMIAFDYKNKVFPPFIFDQWEENKLKTKTGIVPVSDHLVRNVASAGHELAFHGYNHVSLEKKLWKNPEFIVTALKAVQKKWEISKFGPMPVTYVPPSNIIDKDGVRLLKKGMPSLKFMCSLYLGELESGGDREFDFDPFNKDFFDYPRISDGFYLANDKKFSHQALYVYTGIWTHFVHPDDVYQILNPFPKSSGGYDLRNLKGLGWRKTKGTNESLLGEFDQYLANMVKMYPHMRFLDANYGATLTNDWRASRYEHQRSGGNYTVAEVNSGQSLTEQQYWFVYSSKENVSKIESQLDKQAVSFARTPYMDGFLVSVYTTAPKLTLKDLKPAAQSQVITAGIAKAQADLKLYEASAKKFLTTGGEPAWADTWNEDRRKELEELERKIKTTVSIDTASWNLYARMMSWQGKGDEVWNLYGRHVAKHPSKKNIDYSDNLSKIVYYSDYQSHEKWMYSRIKHDNSNVALLENYIELFNIEDNQIKIREVLKMLVNADNSDRWRLRYLEHLLAYEPAEARKLLDQIQPASVYAPVATDATWLYADQHDYQRAYQWSLYSEDIDMASKLSWLLETRSFQELENVYKQYIAKNPEDHQTIATMVEVYHQLGRFKEAWELAATLPAGKDRDRIVKMLNKDVLYVDKALQLDLMNTDLGIFNLQVKDSLLRVLRRETGNFIALNSGTETNRKNPMSFKNVLSYNWYNKKAALHSVGLTYSTMYDIELPVSDADNRTHAVGGVQYQYNNPRSFDKLQYWGRARVEVNQDQKLYYHTGMGANFSRNKGYHSAEFKIFPFENGPAYSKNIYRMQLNLYNEKNFFNAFSASLSLEGNHYTPSSKDAQVYTTASYEGSITSKVTLDNGKPRKWQLLPFLEGSLSQASLGRGNADLQSGYPYWMIDDRLFGGGGLGVKYGLDTADFRARVEAAHFFDDYSKEFQRFTGNVAFQLFDYTAITASFEVYVQSKFYSNNLQLGIKHNLKKKNRKR
jgi:hypothetical protein